METLKFTRTQWALTTCGHADLQRYYTRSNMGASMEKQSVKRRRQQFNQKGCMKVRQIVQGGAMNLKSNLNLR